MGSLGTWHQHLGACQKAWHFTTNGYPIGKASRKGCCRKKTQADGMTYANIPIRVPYFFTLRLLQRWGKMRHQESENSDTQLSLAHIHRIAGDRPRGRAVYFIAVKRVGGFVHAAALDGFGSRNIVQPAVSQVGAPVVERLVLFVLPENNQYPYWQALPFEPDGRARSGQFRNSVKADGQLA